MLINSSSLSSIYRGFNTVFNTAFTQAKPKYTQIATVVPSVTRSENYKWIGQFPKMREWIGDRVIQNLSAYDYEIKNRDWEVTVEIDRNDIEDDSYGVYKPIIEMMGLSAAIHPDELIFDLLVNGFITRCYDGKAFISSEHPNEDGNSQSNKGTAALSIQSYSAARAQMMNIVDTQGKPLLINPSLLVVPPLLEGKAREILFADQINGTTNVFKGTAELLVSPFLSRIPTAWFLLDTSAPIKPLIFQQRKKPSFVAKYDPQDENVFMRKQYLYGTDCRDNAGYGLWQMAFGSTGEVVEI